MPLRTSGREPPSSILLVVVFIGSVRGGSGRSSKRREGRPWGVTASLVGQGFRKKKGGGYRVENLRRGDGWLLFFRVKTM